MSTTAISALEDIFDDPVTDVARPMLSLRDLSVRFGGIAALSEVNLDVGPHDIAAIIGPNGAGKTTTLNAICRIISSSGSVIFDGIPIERLPSWRVAAAGIGRSFQDPPLIDHYTVLENVLCGAHLRLTYGMAAQVFRRPKVNRLEAAAVKRGQSLLEFVGLGDVAQEEAGSLPFGARKLVDIARAMVSGPRLLLLDEPSSGLDAAERHALEEILLELRREARVAVLAVEHHMDLVRRTATQVVALQAGRVLMTGSAEEVLDSEQFRVAIVGGARDVAPTDQPGDDAHDEEKS